MSALRAVIVDDEPLARRNLVALLAQDPAVEVVAQCGCAEEALAALPACRPDLVFLDIEMPECDGFTLLERLGSAPEFAVVFVTAHHQFALKAFEVGALDYILKPFDDARFFTVLARAKARVAGSGMSRRFLVRNAGTLDVVKFAEIDWIEASDYYSTLHAGGRAHMLRRSLTELDGLLAAHGFRRIHRSAIVNLDRIATLELRADGEYEAVLRTGDRLRISRSYRKAILDSLGEA